MTTASYPVRVEASLDRPLSRWLWLVKWLLALPHLVVLALLWVGFVVTSIGAFLAILVTGRYPRPLFDFNVGVLRWSWRVQYYTYGALATDRYPPFTLADVPDYPAHLDIAYPDHLSRGLVLVKWWLLAIPHYLVVGAFVGGGIWTATNGRDGAWAAGGLISLLALFAAVALSVTGRYPQSLFDLVLGMNRWVLRVAAYAALMTDAYPPFRMDLGGREPEGALSLPGPSLTKASAPAGAAPPAPAPQAGPGRAPGADHPPVGRGWTGGRVVSVVAGAAVLLLAVGLSIGGAATLAVDRLNRHQGFLTSPDRSFGTAGYALVTEDFTVEDTGFGWGSAPDLLDTVRIRVVPAVPGTPLFVGIGPSADVARYLAGVRHTEFGNLAGDRTAVQIPGGPPALPPAASGAFTASVTGTGRQVLTWPVQGGTWTVVVMRADRGAGVAVRADVGARLPSLPWIAGGALVAGLVLLAAGLALVIVPARAAGAATSNGG